jgi:hypothetical protein
MSESSSFAALRRFSRPRAPVERCDMCSAPVAAQHPHVLEVAIRRLHCCCDPCAILFGGQEGGRFRRVPAVFQRLPDFRLSDAAWDCLHIPIHLAFFYDSSTAGKVVALYPSPAGATESLLPLDAWQSLVEENPILRELEPDVEALLVNRVGTARVYYRISIDECYKLVGLIRTHWRGLSGGVEVWPEIGRFFTALEERAHA